MPCLPWRPRPARTLTTALLSLAAAALAAPAAAAWSVPFDLGASAAWTAPEVLVDDEGNATAVWIETDEATSRRSLVAARRPAGGTWGARQVLFDGGGKTSLFGDLDAEVGGDGRVTVAYTRSSSLVSATTVVATATAPAGGPFAAPQNVTPEGGENINGEANGATPPDLAAGEDGSLVLAWRHRVQHGLNTDTSRHYVRVARRAPGQGWGAIQDLTSIFEHSRYVHAAAGPQGEAVVTWTQRCDTSADPQCLDALVGSSAPAGGAFGAQQTIDLVSQDSAGGASRVVIDPAGTATVAWTTTPPSARTALRAARRPAGGAWSSPQRIDAADRFHPSAGSDPGPALAVAADGTAAVGWLDSAPNFDRQVPMVARRTAAGWQAPEDASGGLETGAIASVALAGNATGSLVAVWSGSEGTGADTQYVLYGAVRRPTAGFAAPAIVSRIPYNDGFYVNEAAAMAPDGRAFAAWHLGGIAGDKGPRAADAAPVADTTQGGGGAGGGETSAGSGPAPGGGTSQPPAVVAPPTVVAPPVQFHELSPAQRALLARKALGGSAQQTVKKAPASVPAKVLLKAGASLPVFTARPNVDVTGGLAGLIGPAAGNLIGPAAGNLIGPAAGNLISDNGLGVVAGGGANLRAAAAAAKKPRKATVLARGTRFFAEPGSGKLRVKLNARGREALKKAFARRGKQKVKLTYVLVLSQRGSGLPAVYGSRTVTIRE